MRVLAVHPGPLMYTKIYLRLEPLGLELVAEGLRQAGHDVRLIDLQVESREAYMAVLREWKPDVVALSCNYLANVPEIVDLAKVTKAILRTSLVCVGGHSASFIASQLLSHATGTIDCVLRGEGEEAMRMLLEAAA
ncbi:MAG: cobalamin-dependent protein, partial [Nitrospira sp.]|nr:cobalamin-dependent protein [Nitrospira sp.]